MMVFHRVCLSRICGAGGKGGGVIQYNDYFQAQGNLVSRLTGVSLWHVEVRPSKWCFCTVSADALLSLNRHSPLRGTSNWAFYTKGLPGVNFSLMG